MARWSGLPRARNADQKTQTGRGRHAGARHVPRRDGQHPARAPALRDPRCEADGPRQARDAEPGRLREGPHRTPDDRSGRARRPAEARRNDRRTDLGEHRTRTRDRRGGPGVPVHLRDAGQDEPGEDLAAARLRCRGRDLPDRRRTRIAGELLPGRRSVGRGDPGCVPAEPVPQPRESPDALRDHRSGDLGTDRRTAHGIRLWCGNRRDDLGCGALPEGAGPGCPGGGRRSGGLDLLGRFPAALPRGGHRRGLLPDHVRPLCCGPLRPRLGP